MPNSPFSLPLQLSPAAALVAFGLVLLAFLPDAEAAIDLPNWNAGLTVSVAALIQLFIAVEAGWLLRPLRQGVGSLLALYWQPDWLSSAWVFSFTFEAG